MQIDIEHTHRAMKNILTFPLLIVISIFLVSGCDSQVGLRSTDEAIGSENSKRQPVILPDHSDLTVTSTRAQNKYLQSFRESGVYQSFKNENALAGRAIKPLWHSTATLTSDKYPGRKVLVTPIVSENGERSQFLYLHIIDGLNLRDGNRLTLRDEAYYRKAEADMVENSKGTVLIPILISVENHYGQNRTLLYREAEIVSLHTDITILKSRKLPNGEIIELTRADEGMLAEDCEDFLDCLTSTLGEFFEDMGYIYQLIAEGSCYACFSTANPIQCNICAGVAGIPIVEFSIICAIDEDLGLCY